MKLPSLLCVLFRFRIHYLSGVGTLETHEAIMLIGGLILHNNGVNAVSFQFPSENYKNYVIIFF